MSGVVNPETELLTKFYKPDTLLSNIDCLRILQQLNISIFGAISFQSLTMIDFNYNLSNLLFSEKLISISIYN